MTNAKLKRLGAKALNRMTTGEAALALATAGVGLRLLPVCPPDHRGVGSRHAAVCKNPGKVPRRTDWRATATDEPRTIAAWFTKGPNSNLGLLTGAVTGIIAVDVDGEYGKRKLDELLVGIIPVTWEFPTPGGGMRFLFRVPKRQPPLRKYTDQNPAGGHEELAILADGQMTIIPPSRHANGGQYQWSPGRGPYDVPLADAPEAILMKLIAAPPNERNSHQQRDCSGFTLAKDTGASEHHTWHETGDLVLDALSSRCLNIRGYIEQQLGVGCGEQDWRYVTSMLVRAGHIESAFTFSELSVKHDHRSEQRIIRTQRESHGPTLCTTFGCDTEQILRCFGSIRKNGRGVITNTPAMLLSRMRQGRDKGEGDTYG